MPKRKTSPTDTVAQALPENFFLGLVVINTIYSNVGGAFSERNVMIKEWEKYWKMLKFLLSTSWDWCFLLYVNDAVERRDNSGYVFLSVFLKGFLSSNLLFCLFPSRPRNVMVYNCTTGGTNPFHWGEVGMPYFFFS